MSQNRFEYSEPCPICRDAGIVGEDSKPVPLGFDIDTSTICCIMGHEFESLPSETVAAIGDTPVASVSDTALPVNATAEATIEASVEPYERVPGSEFGHSLDAVSGVNELASVAADSQALSELSQRIAEGMNEKAEFITPEVRTVADSGVSRLADRITRREAGEYMVGPGGSASLPNGDLLLGLRIPEQWRQAIESEAEIQGKGTAQYLSDWLQSEEMQSSIVDALVSFWSSSFSQTVAGSPR